MLSTGAVTDRANLERVDWPAVVRVLSRNYAVVQAAVTEPAIPGTIVRRGLSVRQYLALIAVADAFVGGTTGGSHAAAAFSVPSLIIAWRTMLDHVRFPVSGLSLSAAFLYPQQWLIAAEALAACAFRESSLKGMLEEMRRHGRAGRPTHLGNHRGSRCGFRPATPRRVMRRGSRLVALPN